MPSSVQNRDWALFLLRIAVAAVFLYHGTQKWVFWDAVPPDVPLYLVQLLRVLSIAEPLAAIALLAGAATHAASLGLLIVMASALTMKVRSGEPFPSWEFELVLLTATSVLFIVGPGEIALFAKNVKKKGKKK